MDSPSLERISFQVNSSLASRIVTSCQTAIDEVKQSRPPNNAMADGYRIQKATKILEKTFTKDLINICKEELNLPLEIMFETEITFLQAMTYTEYKAFKNGNGWETIIEGYSVFEGTKEYNPKTYDINYFKERSDNLDLEISKLKEYTTEQVTYLFLWTSTFMSEEIVDPKKISPITAEELAAVILHEIGHAMTIIEHMSDTYHRSEIATNTVKYLNEKADEKTLSDVVTEIKTTTEKVPEEVGHSVSILDKLKGKLLGFDPVIAILFGAMFVLQILSTLYLRLYFSGRYGALNSKFRKTSDTVVTESNESYMERIADEFVSRHGLGRPLANVLVRLHMYYDSGHEHSSFSDAVKAMGLIKATLLSYKIVVDLLGTLSYLTDGTYDPDWLRLEHILLNNMVVFKDDNLSPEVRDYFLKETKILIDVIDKFKNRKTFKIKQLIWGTIFRILSRSSLSDSFSTAGLSADYDALQLLTNGLIKNKLFFHAARIKSI